MKKLSAILILLLALVVVNAHLLPWKSWAHDTLQAQLTQRGIKVEFTLERFEPGILVVKDITSDDLPTAFELLEVHYSPRELLDKKLVIASLLLRSKDGEIRTQDVTVDLAKPNVIAALLKVSNIPLGLVINLLTGGKAQATGNVSGSVPITIDTDGAIRFKNGVLTASKGGTITMAPEAIPGDNEQVEVVRKVMTNFHYQDFSMTLDSGKDKKLSILLQLSGNNPDAYNGREVKLNVRLQGDLLGLYQQNVRVITHPQTLLEQSK